MLHSNNSPTEAQNGQKATERKSAFGEGKITSLEIAELTGKNHFDVMRSIRKQEKAWEEINQCKFALVEFTDAKGEKRPMYTLTKMESLYIRPSTTTAPAPSW